MTILPENILSKMSKADRESLGKGGRTRAECEADFVAKSEKDLQSQLYQLLYRRGHKPRMQRTDKRSQLALGTPDISFEVNGLSVHWECKMPGQKPKPHQVEMMSALAEPPNSAIVRVIHSYREGLDHLSEIGRRNNL